MWKCPDCGSIVSDSMDFCTGCGAYSKNRSTHVDASEIHAARTSNVSPIMKYMVIFVSLMMIMSLMGVLFPPHQPSDDVSFKSTWTSDGVEYSLDFMIPGDVYKDATGSKISRDGSVYAVPDHSKGIYSPEDFIVVDEFMIDFCEALHKEYINRSQGITSNEAFTQYLLDFVQTTVVYTEDSEQNGQEEYWMYPVEVLKSKKGDCEDSSILLTAIYHGMAQIDTEFDIQGSSFILLPGHAMSSVDIGEYADGSYYVACGERNYAVCETTGDDFKIGELGILYVSSLYETYDGFVKAYV